MLLLCNQAAQLKDRGPAIMMIQSLALGEARKHLSQNPPRGAIRPITSKISLILRRGPGLLPARLRVSPCPPGQRGFAQQGNSGKQQLLLSLREAPSLSLLVATAQGAAWKLLTGALLLPPARSLRAHPLHCQQPAGCLTIAYGWLISCRMQTGKGPLVIGGRPLVSFAPAWEQA